MIGQTLNKMGIIVPYDKKTELGYRPVPFTKSRFYSERIVSMKRDNLPHILDQLADKSLRFHKPPSSCSICVLSQQLDLKITRL